MEQVFEVTGIIDGDLCNLPNGSEISITTDDGISNCAYIITLPEQLSHDNGVDNPQAMEKGDSSQLIMELADVPDDAVAFTELRDLDNGVVTKIDSNDAIGLEEEEPEKPDATASEVFISFSMGGNDGVNAAEQEAEDILISLNGDKIFSPDNLRNLIHQRHPKECNEDSVDEDEKKPIQIEEVEEDSSIVVMGEGVSLEIKEDLTDLDVKKGEAIAAIDHCNNEPKLTLLKKPVKTYSRKSKAKAEQPVPGPTRALPALVPTIPVDSEMSTSPSSPDRKPPQIFVKTPEKLSIRIPRKKRYLIMDSQKQINNADFKKQLLQTGDIQQSLDLGPTSKMAAKLCAKSAGVAQLFSSPGRPIQNVPLSKLYSNNLVMNVDRDPYMRRRKESPTPNIAPLSSNDLKIHSGEGDLPGPSQSSGRSTKKRIEIGKLAPNSLEQEFKCYHRTGVFKAYTSWKWVSPNKSSKRFSSLSYSMLKRNRELRRERYKARLATPISTGAVCGLVPMKEENDGGNDDTSQNVSELGSAQQPVKIEEDENAEESEAVPTSCETEGIDLSVEIEISDDKRKIKDEPEENTESVITGDLIFPTLPSDQHDMTVSTVEDVHPCPLQDATPDVPKT